jgi:rSAM/selenodomain-associated transferase 2
MRFSIIIPVLNEERSLPFCLASLKSLRDRAEIIVCDGGSTDNTVGTADELADQVLISKKGRARQMNVAAQHAQGDILLFLHADTFLPDGALTLIEKKMTNGRKWGRFDIRLSGQHKMLRIIAFMMNWRSRLTGIATGDQVIFVTRETFVEVGGYPDIDLMEDITLCKALKKIGPPVCLSTQVTSSGRRWEQFGVLRTMFLMWSLRLRFFLGGDPSDLSILYHRGHFWKR